MRMAGVASLFVLAAACSQPRDADTVQAANAVKDAPLSAPVFGIAVRDSAGAWCAEFPRGSDSLAAGTRVALLLANASPDTALEGRLARPHGGSCETAFPQPRWSDYIAFDLADVAPATRDLPMVAFAAMGGGVWTPGPTGRLRIDIDRDGIPEELVKCAADEGEHFTLWSVSRDAPRVRRAHEYFDWGAIVDRTCLPGEDGTGSH
jgi:hypothetical protein